MHPYIVAIFVGVGLRYGAYHAAETSRDIQLSSIRAGATARLSRIGATFSQSVKVRLNRTNGLAAFVEVYLVSIYQDLLVTAKAVSRIKANLNEIEMQRARKRSFALKKASRRKLQAWVPFEWPYRTSITSGRSRT